MKKTDNNHTGCVPVQEEVKVNEAIANLFYEQCMGTHSGHMANIPNNPVLMSICVASGVKDVNSFKQFLASVDDHLLPTPF